MPAPVLTPPKPGEAQAEWDAYASRRNCYCGLWGRNPQASSMKELTPGFCGKCERCGVMGHTRHFPGPVPYTGAWCDRCYRIVGFTSIFRSPATWIVIAIVAYVAYPLLRRLMG